MKTLLKKHTDGDSLQAINSLNQQIKAHNQQEGLKNDESCSILTNALVGIASDFATLKASLKSTPNDQVALGKVASLDEQLGKIRRKNHYPEDWTLNLSTKFRNSVRQQRPREESNSVSTALSEMGTGKRRERGNGDSTKVPGMPCESTTSKSDKKGFRDETSSPGKPYWEPGMTDDGEKILGYKPYYRTIRKTGKTDLYGVQFVVERRGASNPIVLLSGTEVGNRVKDAYLGLPEDQKNDIRYSDQRYSHEDADRFEELLGWATKAMASVDISEPITRYPPGYGLVKFKTGDNDILSRTALRKILGTRDADKEIAKFDPRKPQRPGKGQRKPRVVQHDLEGSIDRARRDLEDVGDPDSLFVPERKSRRSREPQLTLAQEPANAELQDLVDLLFSELKKVNNRLDKTGRSDEDQLQASSLPQRFASLRG
nr:hypothetical protein [Nostoc sp. EkiNYC01]